MKRSFKTSGALAATAAAALILSACGEAPDEAPETDESAPAAEEVDFKACLVSDEGGWDDRSFNQSAHEGLEDAIADLGIDHAEAQSTAESDYAPNVDTMVQQGCDLVFGVGFMLEEGLTLAAQDNPDTTFALIDSYFQEELENGKPLVFNTGEAAYLAGYVAAAVSETGVVGTWGGIQIPSVTVFMDGFADGVERYNTDNDADVRVVGWDKDSQQGSFSGDFSNQTQGRAVTEQLLSQDADIIMPVAGNAGVGAGPAIEEAEAKMIWVDSDGFESTDYGNVILTSVLKEISAAVYATIEEGVNGEFTTEPYIGTLENEGVGLAPFHDFDSEVPDDVKEAVEQIRQEIIDGETVVESENAPS
ncbi:BMP family ABC transporter substrate-binding protein [Nesterenkonia rhizosphaerae]|uniref:BMP family ABC transporter substrate-binding protein n=1 Tax=Nesterenkonia rhizosphaerae TaxID=1348272 RepID=A0ABP9G2N1_9MICC